MYMICFRRRSGLVAGIGVSPYDVSSPFTRWHSAYCLTIRLFRLFSLGLLLFGYFPRFCFVYYYFLPCVKYGAFIFVCNILRFSCIVLFFLGPSSLFCTSPVFSSLLPCSIVLLFPTPGFLSLGFLLGMFLEGLSAFLAVFPPVVHLWFLLFLFQCQDVCAYVSSSTGCVFSVAMSYLISAPISGF